MSDYKDLLGKRFRIVEKGLDPNEVTEYLMREAGSSDSVFKQLEQFSALQAATKTIDEAIKQAKDLAERARIKASEEAEQRKSQAVEEGKLVATKIIDEAGKSMLDYCDRVSAILVEAIDEAFKKAKEHLTGNSTEMHKQVEKGTETAINQIMKDIDYPARESSDSKVESANPEPREKAASTVSSTSSDPWQGSM